MNRKLVSIQTIPDSVREALGDNLCFNGGAEDSPAS